MSDVFGAGGAVHERRHAAKPKRAHLADRRSLWQGYEHGWLGKPQRSQEPWYAAGHVEGTAAAKRRREIMLEKHRAEARRDSAPAFMAMLDRRANANRMAGA